jgi:DNA-binding response OmpR family regulator
MSSPKPRVLLVEDDLSILTGLAINLRYEGFEVLQAQDGQQGLELALSGAPDVLVLDVMLPKLNGYEVVADLRSRGSRLPVIMLSAKGQEEDKIAGLDSGADDYVTKPFGLQELLARIKAALRRSAREPTAVRFGDVVVDVEAKRATRGGKDVELTAQELRLLIHFVTHPGRAFSREDLLFAAWGMDYQGSARTVDNFMRQLRQKLEPDPEAPIYFVTVRGMGYRFDGDQTEA